MILMIDNDGIIYLSKGTKLIKQICPYNSQQFISGEGKSGGYSGEFAGWQNQTTKYVDIPCSQSCPKCKELYNQAKANIVLKYVVKNT